MRVPGCTAATNVQPFTADLVNHIDDDDDDDADDDDVVVAMVTAMLRDVNTVMADDDLCRVFNSQQQNHCLPDCATPFPRSMLTLFFL